MANVIRTRTNLPHVLDGAEIVQDENHGDVFRVTLRDTSKLGDHGRSFQIEFTMDEAGALATVLKRESH